MLRLLFLDDPRDDLWRNRLHIGRVGKARIGHDRGGIGVNQNDPIPLFPQRFARLRAGIVEFTRLADDNGACPDDQDAVDILAFGHEGGLRQLGIRDPIPLNAAGSGRL